MNYRKISLIFFVALPLVEIALFIIVGKLVGLVITLLLVSLSTIFGLYLLHHVGFVEMRKMRNNNMTKQEIQIFLLNFLRMISACLLILPGFITDLIGLLLLIPSIQKRVIRQVYAGYIKQHAANAETTRIIEGEYTRED